MKLMRLFILAALSTGLVMVMLGIDGCKHSEKNPSVEEIPSDLQIIFGQQGTFAGRSMGYSIYGDGQVVRWEGKYPEENKEATATVDADHVRRLWKRAQEIGFLEMSDQAMATVNTFITLTADGESRRVTWVDRDANAPTPAQKFYDECVDVAKKALGEISSGGGSS